MPLTPEREAKLAEQEAWCLGMIKAIREAGLFPISRSAVADELARRGHAVRFDVNNHAFGGAQLIVRTPHGYLAGSDHRKEGQAVGF